MIIKIFNKIFEYNDFFEEYFIKEEFYEKHKKIMLILEFICDYFVI